MYYIVNQRDHIIAADSSFLALFGVSTIEDLHKDIALGTAALSSIDGQALNLTVSGETQGYSATQERLSTLLGDMTLISLREAQKTDIETGIETDTEATASIIDDEPITFDLGSDDNVAAEEEEISFLKEEPKISMQEEEKPFAIIEEERVQEELSEPEEEKETETSTEVSEADESPIYIDIQNISQKIGISEEDYTHFLNEYIDTALTLEEDLKSTQEKKRAHAVNTLAHLSNVLHLPIVTTIVEDIKNNIEDKSNRHIEALYATLARLTTTAPETEQSDEKVSVERGPTVGAESFGTIDLSDVKPIHFDFQLEESANDLSLPVELIEEFVIDFIEQAHDETKKMLAAYELGDLPTIQKIGHLLKGTSSNLRINPLSDTLYEIQFCEDSSKLEGLIKEYWGHFLSFEHQINMKLK